MFQQYLTKWTFNFSVMAALLVSLHVNAESILDDAIRTAGEANRLAGLESQRNVQKLVSPLLSMASNALSEAPTKSIDSRRVQSAGLDGKQGTLSIWRATNGSAALAITQFPAIEPSISFAFYSDSIKSVCQAPRVVGTYTDRPCLLRALIDGKIKKLKISKFGPVIGGSVMELAGTIEFLGDLQRLAQNRHELKIELSSDNGIQVYDFDASNIPCLRSSGCTSKTPTSNIEKDTNFQRYSGSQLKEMLSENPESSPVKVMFAAGYVTGWYDALQGIVFCKLENATLGTVSAAVLDRFNRKPQTLDDPIEKIMIETLAEKWPCSH